MGKQIKYWMEYESFLKIAETALNQNGLIIPRGKGETIQGNDLSVVTSDCHSYYFYFPSVGEVTYKLFADGRKVIDSGYTSSGNTMIEAGFSYIRDKTMTRSRLFTISGYYGKAGDWIPSPDEMTKIYNCLVRQAKKIAPYTELTNTAIYKSGERYGEQYEWRHKK